MKTILTAAKICSAASALALLALSAMTVAPQAQGGFDFAAAVVVILLMGWAALGFWARAKLRADKEAAVSPRLKNGVVVGASVYLAVIFLGVLG